MNARGLSLLLALSAMGCGSGSDEEHNDAGVSTPCTAGRALQTITSESGSLTIYVCAAAAPALGYNSFTYLMVDQSGAPQSGLELTVQPWMPYMNHGSPATPTVVSSGDGQYQVDNVVFQMAGAWQLRTSIAAPTPDNADPQFNID